MSPTTTSSTYRSTSFLPLVLTNSDSLSSESTVDSDSLTVSTIPSLAKVTEESQAGQFKKRRSSVMTAPNQWHSISVEDDFPVSSEIDETENDACSDTEEINQDDADSDDDYGGEHRYIDYLKIALTNFQGMTSDKMKLALAGSDEIVEAFFDDIRCLLTSDESSDEVRNAKQTIVNFAKTQSADFRFRIFNADNDMICLSGFDLSGMNFAGINLRAANFSKSILNGANFSGTDLSGANCDDADFRNVIFNGTNMEYGHFEKANFFGAKLNSSSVYFANFCGADLRNGDFTGLDLRETRFANANLENVSFKDANLYGVWFTRANLKMACFNGANLNGAWFAEANLENVSFKGANLDGARFARANLKKADFSGIVLQHVYLGKAILIGAIFDGANFEGANLSGADLRDVNFSGLKLHGKNFSGPNFSGANLCGANFKGLNLFGVNLRDADLRDADLSGANLTDVIFGTANLGRANLRLANLHRTKFIGSTLYGADLRGANILWTEFSVRCGLDSRLFVVAERTDHEFLAKSWRDTSVKPRNHQGLNIFEDPFIPAQKSLVVDMTKKPHHVIPVAQQKPPAPPRSFWSWISNIPNSVAQFFRSAFRRLWSGS